MNRVKAREFLFKKTCKSIKIFLELKLPRRDKLFSLSLTSRYIAGLNPLMPRNISCFRLHGEVVRCWL